jgi:hypothetical protein
MNWPTCSGAHHGTFVPFFAPSDSSVVWETVTTVYVFLSVSITRDNWRWFGVPPSSKTRACPSQTRTRVRVRWMAPPTRVWRIPKHITPIRDRRRACKPEYPRGESCLRWSRERPGSTREETAPFRASRMSYYTVGHTYVNTLVDVWVPNSSLTAHLYTRTRFIQHDRCLFGRENPR